MDNTLYNIVNSKDAIYTNIPYNILTSKYKDNEFKINVDLLPELKHPKFLLIGGNLAVKYTNYLEKELFNNISLLRRFVSIAKLGVEKGTIALVCNCKIGKQDNRVAHSEVIKYFLFKYHETLIKLSPYLFNNAGDINKTDEEIDEDLKMLSDTLKITLINNLNTSKMLSGGSIKNLDKLSDTDKEQIKNLLTQQLGITHTAEIDKALNIENKDNDNEVTYEESSEQQEVKIQQEA